MSMESLLIWQSQNVQKSFIKAIAPVFSALFMKKREKTPKNHQMNLVSENFKE